MNMKQKIADLQKRVDDYDKRMKSIIGSAEGAKRDMTAAEFARVKKIAAEKAEVVTELKGTQERYVRGLEAHNLLASLGQDESGDGSGEKHLALAGRGAKALARDLADTIRDRSGGQKALVPAGTFDTPMPTTVGAPVPQGAPAASLLSLLTAIPSDTPGYSYLRQTVRENAAAIVEPGALKPESTVTVERVDAELKVIAHTSEPIDKYLLQDYDTLVAFVERQLLWGVQQRLQAYIVAPAGSSNTIPSLASTTGVQQQAYTGTVLGTLLAARTQLEVSGYTPGAFVLHPTTWAALEGARNQSGNFDLNGPIDAATRRLWGVPVTLVPEADPGNGFLVDLATLVVRFGAEGMSIDWDRGGELFDRNQVKARVEGRFQLDVLRPAGTVFADLTA